MSNKYTKQGVRDLNHIKGKSVGRKIEMPPIEIMCKHPKEYHEKAEYGHTIICGVCGKRLSD